MTVLRFSWEMTTKQHSAVLTISPFNLQAINRAPMLSTRGHGKPTHLHNIGTTVTSTVSSSGYLWVGSCRHCWHWCRTSESLHQKDKRLHSTHHTHTVQEISGAWFTKYLTIYNKSVLSLSQDWLMTVSYNVLRFLLGISYVNLQTLHPMTLWFCKNILHKKSLVFFVRCLGN